MNKIEEHINNIFKFFITKQDYEMIENAFIITSKKSLDIVAKEIYLSNTYEKISERLKFNPQLLLVETGHVIEYWSNCESLIKRMKSLFKLLKIDYFFDFDHAELFANTFGYYSGKFVVPILQMPNEKELEQSYKLNIVEGALFINRYYKNCITYILKITNKEINKIEVNGDWIEISKTLDLGLDIDFLKENKNTKKNFIKSIFTAKTIEIRK